MKYLLVDLANGFYRARHITKYASDTDEKVGFALHVTLSSILKAWRDYNADHVIICLEGRSWRKDFYAPYKKNRAVARAALTEQEAEEERVFFEALDELQSFFIDSTNCTVLKNSRLEADDLIAGFIQMHESDEHVIISTDSDYHQLLASNVKQYDGVKDETHSIDGIFDGRGRPVMDKKTKLPKTIPEPQWILFEKCIRGDTSDNVFSAYPGVRTKGTKNKIGLLEAYADKNSMGFAWNNLMLQTWIDHNNVEHRVMDDYQRNKTLIDLTAQPQDVRDLINETVSTQCNVKNNQMVGAKFLKFCGKHELVKISEMASQYATMLTAKYGGGV